MSKIVAVWPLLMLKSRPYLIRIFAGLAVAIGATVAWLIVNWFISVSFTHLVIVVFLSMSVFLITEWFFVRKKSEQ